MLKEEVGKIQQVERREGEEEEKEEEVVREEDPGSVPRPAGQCGWAAGRAGHPRPGPQPWAHMSNPSPLLGWRGRGGSLAAWRSRWSQCPSLSKWSRKPCHSGQQQLSTAAVSVINVEGDRGIGHK